MKPTQQRRQLAISTALGADDLVLNRITVRERMSAPFEIEAELSATNANVDSNKVVGHPATIRIEEGGKGTRYFNGYVNRLAQTGNQGGFARYRATIVPWFWFLTRTADCRVFQRKSVLDIADEVFNGNRFGSEFYDPRTKGPFPKRRYCVQYRETDLNFISRLLESEGIYYWFEHQNGKHKLVLADGIGGSKPAAGYETLEFQELTQRTDDGREVITDWMVEKQVQPVQCVVKDFDFKKPSDPLKADHQIQREHGMARFAVYDYPGEYFEPGDAGHYAQLRAEEMQSRHELVHGVTTARGLAVGGVFTLQKYAREDQNRKYLITELSLTVDAGEFASGGTGDEFLVCNFTAIPAQTPYRPARLTPKPVIQGIQTATVVGPAGEEIHVDEYGRVMIQFHWDRYGKKDETSSCFVRVSQSWAGKQWGAVHHPRIGQEVLVEFLEGDPDRPIITGRVYNNEQMPPYELPANKTQSGIKSRSTQKGSPENFNEIRFEDKKGEEQLYIHAEKNQDNVVENDETTKVGHDRTEDVGNDEKITIKNDRTENVGNDESITIGKDRTESVGKNESISIGESRTEDVTKDESITIGGGRTESVGKDESITIGGSRKEDVAKKEQVTIGDERTVSVSKNDGLSVGKKLVIDAGDEISITTGSASISMQKDGTIKIKGKDITIEGSGKINVKASSDVVIKGSKVAAN